MDSTERVTLGKGDMRWAYKRSRETIEWDLKADEEYNDKEKKDEREIV